MHDMDIQCFDPVMFCWRGLGPRDSLKPCPLSQTAHSQALRELEKEHVVNLGLRVKTEELLQERAALQQR